MMDGRVSRIKKGHRGRQTLVCDSTHNRGVNSATKKTWGSERAAFRAKGGGGVTIQNGKGKQCWDIFARKDSHRTIKMNSVEK